MHEAKTMNDLLSDLNPPQREAVLATKGPVLVLAGAGSGKTRALVHRIAYLIKEEKVSPFNILAVTFTNKAAGEMGERVIHLLNAKRTTQNEDAALLSVNRTASSIRLPWLGTFHSICARILRREAQYIGYERNFTIYDDTDQLAIIKRMMRDLNIDPKQFAPQAIRAFISGAKNELIDAKEYKKYNNSPFEVMTSKVFEKYESYLREQNGMDFDDLIGHCVRLFEKNPKVLEQYQNQFRYILIDEYQDTNQAQYLWTKMLAERDKNIMVVGDDSQSIYSWRGANFRNILNFERDYPKAKVIKLEQNYRSTQTILSAANEIIKYNRQKTNKLLWTENPEGLPITVYEALNEKDEAEFVALEIASLMRRPSSYSDFAVLYRTNAQSRAIEESFLKFNIPYRVVGGIRFYERKEIKDIISYLRLIANPNDFEALERAVSSPPRGIGKKTIDKYRKSREEGVGRGESGVSSQTSNSQLQTFLQMMEEIREYAKDVDLPTLIEHLAVKTGYKSYLLDGTAEGEGRWENILELVSVAQSIQEIKNQKSKIKSGEDDLSDNPLEEFLEKVALVQDTDEIDQNAPVVTLMTLHAAKGLEFKVVFIVGIEEGIFPHSRALLEESEMEEERRLCYVGVTRARERLYLIYASERVIFGRFQSNPKSRFIEHIPECLIDKI
jgi:DNA helicase-2/ATP-dependent DNA helicase PcrA